MRSSRGTATRRNRQAQAGAELRAIGYVRCSTQEQARSGLGLGAQAERVAAYASAAGLELVDVVREEGVSGGVPLAERPAGAALLERLCAGDACHLVALKLDRLFRDAADCLAQTRTWDRQGVALHFLDLGGQALNTASAMGRMFLTLSAAFALGSDGRTLVPVAQEQAAIRMARKLEAEGLSLRAIGAALDKARHAPRGGRWWPNTVLRLLRRSDPLTPAA